MRKIEFNRFSMFKEVLSIMDKNASQVSSIPALKNAFVDLKAIVDEMDGTNLKFVGRTKGETSAKHEQEEVLCNWLLRVSGALVALGKDTHNTVLVDDVKVNKSEMLTGRDSELINKATLIYEQAEHYQTELANYGITAQALADAKTALDDFKKSISEQMGERDNVIAMRLEITKKLDAGTDILTGRLDGLMENFRIDAPVFYSEYQAARVIKDLGLRHEDQPSDNTTNE